MKDMLTIIYQELLKNPVIKEKVTKERIQYYEYPENADHTRPFMILIPLSPPTSGTFGSDKELSQVLTYQIDVQGRERMEVKEIQAQVKRVMFGLGFFQLPEGLDKWFEGTQRHVDARRYRINTKLYDNNY